MALDELLLHDVGDLLAGGRVQDPVCPVNLFIYSPLRLHEVGVAGVVGKELEGLEAVEDPRLVQEGGLEVCLVHDRGAHSDLHQHVQDGLEQRAIHKLALALFLDRGQQERAQPVAHFRVVNHRLQKHLQAHFVGRFHLPRRRVGAIHVHENVLHGGQDDLLLGPLPRQRLQKLRIRRFRHLLSDGYEAPGQAVLHAGVQQLSMLIQDQIVR
mmetsp:Transcript_16483/g.62682  ORF Transcript_16483/g.62682 Transcript_16483/m.62682 type:complete len:212 (-) Transcript_16483:395-1030(-)